MASLKKFLIGLFSSSTIFSFIFIYYYCSKVIGYIPEDVSFGSSLATLVIALRLFIPLSVGVFFTGYLFFLNDVRRLAGNNGRRLVTKIILVSIVGSVVVCLVNDYFNTGYLKESNYALFLFQGGVFILASALIWLMFVNFPASALGRKVLAQSASSAAVGLYSYYQAIVFLFTLSIGVALYFWCYASLGWGGLVNMLSIIWKWRGSGKVMLIFY